ncbi:Target of EGR1, member 1 (Nuclear) [Chamberlinius hualienensis]
MANDLRNVPIVIVNKSNFVTIWPSLIHAVDKASVIGIDIELSGLGDRRSLSIKDIEERYKAVASVAQTRAILSLGIACFCSQQLNNETISVQDADKWPDRKKIESEPKTYVAQIFDISLLCTDEYVVEPLSLQFLVNHGFDFNMQFSKGLSYKPGNDDEQKKKVVVHNGFLDLLFLYQHLYTQLPPKLGVFIADLCEMFEGIYDTKFVAEFCLQFKASYLEYMFKRLQRLNDRRRSDNKAHIRVQFLNYHSSFDGVDFDDLRSIVGKPKCDLCTKFASHGWCPDATECTKSHDVDRVLDEEEIGKKKKKRKREENGKENAKEMDATMKSTEDSDIKPVTETPTETTNDTSCEYDNSVVKKGSHRAGYDSFMTAYALLVYYATSTPQIDITLPSENLELTCGRIYLGGKDQPLAIKKGNFAKTSKNHKLKQSKH